MVDYNSKGYTNEQIETIIAEYKASGDGITVFCKKRDYKPSYSTLKGWLDIAGEVSTAKQATPAPAAPASLAEVEAAYKKGIQSLIKELEEREQALTKELDNVMKDLENARKKLTKFD